MDWRCASEGFDSFGLLHVTNHLEVVDVLLGPVQPVVKLVVEVESLIGHLSEHLHFHLGLTQLHEELSSGRVSDIAASQLLESGTMLGNCLTERLSFLLSLLIGGKMSSENLYMLVHGFLFRHLASVSRHQIFNCV